MDSEPLSLRIGLTICGDMCRLNRHSLIFDVVVHYIDL